MDISWLTPAQVSAHYFNGQCEGRPLSPVDGVREGEEEGENRSFKEPSPLHREQVGRGIIIQLCLVTVNNAQRFNAHKRRIIGNRMPGDF